MLLDEVNELLCNHVGVQFWSHFDWFDFSAVNDEDFASKIEKSLYKANSDLLIAKMGILEQYEALCEENLIQASFSAPGVQRALVRTLHHLETLWHLVVLPTPSVILSAGSRETAIRGGLWKKLFFCLFSHNFDRVFGSKESEGEDEAAEEEEDKVIAFDTGFENVIRQINLLCLVDPLNDVLKAIVCDKIQARIGARMVGIYDAPDQLKEAQEWLSKSCLNFLAFVLSPDLERDQLGSKLKEWEDSRIKERELANGEAEEASNFDFKSSSKRVASNHARSGGSAYPKRDLSSSIKKTSSQTKRRSSLVGESEESDEDEFELDYASLATNQPLFTPARSASAISSATGAISPLGNVSRMSSPLRPSSPSGASKIPSSPIPLSMGTSLNGMGEWLKKKSIHGMTRNESSQSASQLSSYALQPTSHQSSSHLRLLYKWRAQLTSFLFELTLKLRISELFNLIVDYPNSLPALEDLRTCLNVTGHYGDLIQSLRAAFAKRLMHPGATTADIVTLYISCIRAIKDIDPSTVLLSLVTVDLREYLRQRSDSLRNLVSLLTEDGGEPGISLISDLEASASASGGNSSSGGGGISGSGNQDNDADSDDDADLESSIITREHANNNTSKGDIWNPSPVIRAPQRFASDSGASSSSMASKSKDIISMLIGIHGSKESFIVEYANLLASRLLALSDFATEQEVKNVELMKLKFGEATMHQCEVMLKDMAESKRANTNIHHTIKESLAKGQKVLPQRPSNDEMNASIMPDEEEDNPAIYNLEGVEMTNAIFSHLYWPSSFQPLPVVLPEPWNSQRLAIEHQFSTLKSSRSLVWYDGMGSVDIELCLLKKKEEGEEEVPEGDEDSEANNAFEVKTFTVTPVQAAIIMLFEEREEWDADAMVEKLKLPSLEILRRHTSLWMSNGILLEPQPGLFRLSDRLDASDAIDEDTGLEMDEEMEENFDEFIPFIIAMLKNLGGLPIAKIHQKMTNFNADYELTIQQLKELLEKMVAAETLDVAGGQYSVLKK